MRGWGSGPGMVHEPELEEGKTCYSKDSSFDPDITLSYIGDKVQSILGHFQKDFEGVVSAENLGAKFGVYGSFLPMYQRSPSHMVQPKSPQKIQNLHMHRSLNHLLSKAPVPSSHAVSGAHTLNNDPVSSHTVPPQNLKTSIEDATVRDKTNLSADKNAETLPRKDELNNCPDKKTLKFRIKVGPERMAKYNAEIHNLGLISPSSSEGNSYEEINGLQHKIHGSPSESPAKILQMMTSTPLEGALLLSPLCEDLLNLIKEKEFSAKVVSKSSPRSADLSLRISNNKNIKMKRRSVEKSKNFAESDKKKMVDLNDCQQKILETDFANRNIHDLNCKPSSDTIGVPEMDAKIKKRKGSKNVAKEIAQLVGSVKGVYLEHTSLQDRDTYEQPEPRRSSVDKIGKNDHKAVISHMDVSANHKQLNRSGDSKNPASLEAYSDFSIGESVQRVSNNPKLGVKVPSIDYNEPGLSQGDDTLQTEGSKKSQETQVSKKLAPKSADFLRDEGCAVPKIENSRKKESRPVDKDVVQTSLRHAKPKLSLERSALEDKPKKSYLDTSKKKPPCTKKTRETSSNKKNLDKVTYDIPKVEAPDVHVLSSEGISTGLEQKLAAPVLIQEDWVGCDRCQKWRLLPYGTKSEHLPDKWVCTMLDWLPGMNRCDISEDETTKAVQALYLVPVPGDQHKTLAHDDRILSRGHHLDRGEQNRVLDPNTGQVKKLKLKEKLNPALTDPISFDGKKKVQQRDLKKVYLEKENQSLTSLDSVSESDMHNKNRLSAVGEKLKKRKGEHLTKDEEIRKKKIKKVSAQHVDGKEQKIKPKSAQVSFRNQGNNDQSFKSGLPGNSALNNGKKSIEQKASSSRGTGNLETRTEKKKDHIQTLPPNRPMGWKTGDEREISVKKIKLKDHGDIKPRDETFRNNGSRLQDKVSVIVKKSQASLTGEEELRKSQGDDISKANHEEGLRSKDYPNERFENEQLKKPRGRMQITMEDIYKLKKDLGDEQVPMTATSSCSKVSDSQNKRSYYTEMKGSPADSVSSSPVRLSYPNQISQMRRETVNGRLDGLSESGSVKKVRGMESRLLDTPIADTSNALKRKTMTSFMNGIENCRNSEAERSLRVDASLTTKNVPGENCYNALKEAEAVLKEADELKSHADLIKTSGFIFESNYEFLKAAVMYLQGASLLEACDAESCKSLEVNPLQMYGTAAKLCKTCACEYEKVHEMAAAALAYKCMELAYLRMIYCKSLNSSRVWHDLQSSLQMNPQGESPSSSASDVDNLNNLATGDKATLSRGIVTRPGNNVIAPRNRPNFVRLLDFTRDVNSAMEAAKKSRDTFASALLELKESRNKEAIDSIKKVINFSFEDVAELIRLVWLALHAISHEGLRNQSE